MANLDSDLDCVGGRQWSLRDSLFDRLTVDPFHPETDGVPDTFGTIDCDDVRMAHAREKPTFLHHGRRARIAGVRPGRQELQRNFAIKMRVPGAVNISKCAAANQLQDANMPPRERSAHRFGVGLLPMKVGNSRQNS